MNMYIIHIDHKYFVKLDIREIQMNSMILESTIDALDEILSRQDDSMTMIDQVEIVAHDTLTLLNIRRRRYDIEDFMGPYDEVELLRHMGKMMSSLNGPRKIVRHKTEKQVRRVISGTIKKLKHMCEGLED